MTHSTWNTSGTIPASGRFRTLCVCVLLTLTLLSTPAELLSKGQQSGLFHLVSSNRTVKDIQIETQIRAALRQDAQLRPLNLGVHMSGGNAKLSGPVPTQELKKRAIKLAQRVDGVLTVSGKDLYISTAEPDSQRVTVILQEERPTQTRSASAGVSSSSLGSVDSRSSASTGQQITLLAPERAAPGSATRSTPTVGERSAGPARLTANPHEASPAVTIALAVEQLRRREIRYQQIRTQVEGTIVYISPCDTSIEDAMTFAQAIRRLPGVRHVILVSNPR